MQGKFIVIEGLEGAGKSTAMQTAVPWLEAVLADSVKVTPLPAVMLTLLYIQTALRLFQQIQRVQWFQPLE